MKHKPNTILYICTSIGNLDNLIDLTDEEPATFDTEAEALEKAKEETEEYGLITYVYKCIPVLKCSRRGIRIDRLSK